MADTRTPEEKSGASVLVEIEHPDVETHGFVPREGLETWAAEGWQPVNTADVAVAEPPAANATKAELLAQASALGITDVGEHNTKAEIEDAIAAAQTA